MLWIKLDADWATNPKVLGVEAADKVLWLASIGWSAQHGTDGFVPEHVLPMLGYLAGLTQPQAAAERLVEARLWDDVEGRDGWAVHDFLEHQSSAEEVEAKARGNRERQARHAAARKAEAEAGRHAVAAAAAREGHGVTNALVTRPDQTRPDLDKNQPTPSRPSALVNDPPVADTLPPPAAELEQGKPTAYFTELAEGWARFAELYPKRNGKRVGIRLAEAGWKRLSPADRRLALAALANYAAARGDDHELSAEDPHRWLKHRRWLDWAEPEQAPAPPARRAPARLTARQALELRTAGAAS